MGSMEYARYVLACPRCRTLGVAEWYETDGGAHVRRLSWDLEISDNFERVPGPDSNDPRSFYGRPLVCKACGIDAERTEVNSTLFYAIKDSAMRSVAGSHDKPSVLGAAHSEDRR